MHSQALWPTYLIMGVLPILFVGVAVPMLRGSVKPNHWYGVRTSKTVASADLWYRANHAAGYAMIVAVGVSLLFWAVVAFVPLPAASRCFIDILVCTGLVVVAMFVASTRAGAF